MSLLDTTQLSLDAAMRGSMLQQSLLTNNLANVDTPGYRQENVDFQGQLESALKSGESPTSVQFTPTTVGGANGVDGNGVSSEEVSAQVSENGLLYQDLTQVAAAREKILLTAIGQPSS